MNISNKIRRLLNCHHLLKQCFRGNATASGHLMVSALNNGIRVATEQTHNPLACIRLFVQVGSRYENADTHGICHFLEHMAFRGFNSMNKQSLAHFLNDIGGRLDALTTREYQVFTGICPSNASNDMVCILSKIVTDLELLESEMALARDSIAMEAKDLDVDPRRIMFDYLKEGAFQGTPLGKRVTGPTNNVERFSRACAFHFLKKNYTPARIILASSGGVSHQNMMTAARQCFCNMPCDSEPIDHGPKRFTAGQVIYRDDSMPFAHVSLAVEAPGFNSRHYIPLLVAKQVIGSWDVSLGGTHRHAPYLAKASAFTSLCERYESFYIAYSDVGLWGTYFVCPRINVDDMVHLLFGTWMHLCMTLRDPEVQRAVNATKLELSKRADNAINSSFDIGLQIMYNNERSSLSDVFKTLSNLSAATLKDVVFEYIYNKTVVVSATGPTEALPDYNRLQAGTYWLRI